MQNGIVYYYAHNHDTHFFGGYMKKSSILTKIMLSLVLVALVFSLVACGGNKKDDNKGSTPTVEEKTLAEQVVDILQGVNPVLKVINDTTANDTLGANLALSVNYNIGGKSEDIALAVKANANATTPAVQISYTQSKTEWLNLTLNDKIVYLVQPLTAVNTSSKTDGLKADITALDPAVKDVMSMIMSEIEGVNNLALPEDLVASVNELLTGQFKSIANLITIETTTDGYKIVLGSKIMGTVKGLLPTLLGGTLTNLVGKSISDKIISTAQEFLAENPELSIEIGLKNSTINKLAIGYKLGTDTANVNLGFDLSSERVSITNPSVGNKALNIGAAAELARKGLKVTAEAYGVPDFSSDGKNIAFATAMINNAVANGYFNGASVYFDTAALYEGLGVTAPDNTKYKATVGNIDETTYAKTDSSIVKMINDAAAEAKAKYNEEKGKEKTASSASYAGDTATEPSKSVNQTVYEMLGGKLEYTDANKTAYKDVSEKDVMTQLDSNIGAYIRFELDTTSGSDNYFKTLKNILTLFGENDQWIIGFDLIKGTGKTVDLTKLTKMDDFTTLGNWLNVDKNNEIVTPAKGTKVFGIFDWDTDNYNGGVTLSKDGAQNDLLDAVNVFVTTGKDESNEYKDVDAKFLADFADYYVAALGYYMDDIIYDKETKTTIDAIDMKYAYAKFQYAEKNNNSSLSEADKEQAKKEYDEAKKAHKDALKTYYTTANANKVINKILGVEFETDTSYVAQLIDGGLYLHLGCEKNAGINGYIEIKDSAEGEGAKSYAYLSGHINVVNNDIDSKVTAANIKTDEYTTELFAPEKVTDDTTDANDYAKIATVEGTNVKKVTKNTKDGVDTYEYVVEEKDGKTQYNDKYAALEGLFKDIGEALVDYLGE